MATERLERSSPNKAPFHRRRLSRQKLTAWRRRLSWTEVVISAALMSVVAMPTMAVEEDWHGHPMIDEPTHLWIIAALLVVAGFLFGGAVAGYRRPSAALGDGVAAASLTVGLLLAADVARRVLIAHNGLPGAVVHLWCLGAVGAVFCGALGAVLGRLVRAGKG
jgi:peptidoglycan/LPS O-acetylase OafA/YrhL